MCRGKDSCSELGQEISNWDNHCPLRPPAWFNEEIDLFLMAVQSFLNGNRDKCLEDISRIKSTEMTEWFIEHGQMSGMYRQKALKIPPPAIIPKEERDPCRSPKRLQNKVFARDHYTCRYCGQRLISQTFMKDFIKYLDSPLFQKGNTNLTTHGIIHATWPVADHVKPWKQGGSTSLTNLVSSCASCNYGKADYTCEQMGIDSPLIRTQLTQSWDGLESLRHRLS